MLSTLTLDFSCLCHFFSGFSLFLSPYFPLFDCLSVNLLTLSYLTFLHPHLISVWGDFILTLETPCWRPFSLPPQVYRLFGTLISIHSFIHSNKVKKLIIIRKRSNTKKKRDQNLIKKKTQKCRTNAMG